MRLTLKQLEYFVAAAEFGSIKRASEAIHISQPSISAAISHIESELGAQLFKRHHARGLSLTRSGQRLLPEVRRLLAQAEGLYTIADEMSSAIAGPLRIGCFVTLAPMIVPELGQSFIAKYPDVKLKVDEGDHEYLLGALKRGEIDVAISYDLKSEEGVGFEPLSTLAPQVLLSVDHRLAKRSTLALKDLAEENLVLLDLPYSREYFLSLYYAEGLTPTIHSRSAHQEVVRTMVANNYGYTLSNIRPKSMTALDGRTLKCVPLKGDYRPMIIGLMCLESEHETQLLNAFRQHCRELINETCIPGMSL
jgi:DNA-binding transcriptional LysR family regulator